MITALLFVLIPILCYLPLFLYETYVSYRRIGKRGKAAEYVHVSWEFTHTLLILGVNNFIWLFSSIVPAVGAAIFEGLMLAAALFIVRGALYLLIYVSVKKSTIHWYDYGFFMTHVLIVLGLLYIVVRAAIVMLTHDVSVNTQFIPIVAPGLLVVVLLCTVPIWQIYSMRKS